MSTSTLIPKKLSFLIGLSLVLAASAFFLSGASEYLVSFIGHESQIRGGANEELREWIKLAVNVANSLVGIGGLVVGVLSLKKSERKP